MNIWDRYVSKGIVAVVLGTTLWLGLAFTNVAYAADPDREEIRAMLAEDTGYFAPASAVASDTDSAAENTGTSLQSIRCRFKSGADNPHRSSTGFAVSAHGWWNETSRPKGQCPEFADVEARLQVAWCDDFTGCRWITLAKKEKRVREGGGSSNRTAVRFDCASTRVVGYRNVVDVDLVGMPDLPNRATREQDVRCYPDI